MKEFGIEETYSFSDKFYDFELYFVFEQETLSTLTLSLVAIIFVVLVITSDFIVTFLITCCVVLTDLFLVGLMYYWGLTINPIVLLNVILAIGTSVDYSAHIGYAYLVEGIPEKKKHTYNTPMKIRQYKA